MIKTELMLEYERETRETLDMSILMEDASGSWYGFLDMMNEKAAAYDRLMSGEYTLKDMANIFKMYSAIDSDGYARLFADPPFIEGTGWSSNFPEEEFSVPGIITHTEDWTTSLTMPDGLEEK